MRPFSTLAAAALIGLVATATGCVTSGIDAALAGDHRSAENRARDAFRHPAQTLDYFGLRPDMTVVELYPGGGWYTEVLAPLLREQGKLVAAHYGADTGTEYRTRSYEGFMAKLRERPDVYDRVEVVAYNPPDQDSLGADGSADMVLTFRSMHGMYRAGTADDFFTSAFRVLKPGGTLGVVQHRAALGARPEESAEKGYLPEATVIKLAHDAGFAFDGQSEINANPRDTKDYPDGVWTLPPTLRKGDEDRAKYLAIGESDRMTLRFSKPKPQ